MATPDPTVESPARTLLVAFMVCAACSILVSTTAGFLEPLQRANQERERQRHIREIVAGHPGLAEMLAGREGVALEARVVELATGQFADHIDPTTFDARRAAADPLLGVALPAGGDPARIGRQAHHAVVYLVEAAGRTELVILPVHGSGYASTLYGYLALAADTNTVAGISFYEHGETPGLGDEIEDPDWLASWSGKRVRDEAGKIRLGVARHEVDPASPDAPFQVDGLTGATRTCKGVTELLRFWLGEHGFAPFLERIRRRNEQSP